MVGKPFTDKKCLPRFPSLPPLIDRSLFFSVPDVSAVRALPADCCRLGYRKPVCHQCHLRDVHPTPGGDRSETVLRFRISVLNFTETEFLRFQYHKPRGSRKRAPGQTDPIGTLRIQVSDRIEAKSLAKLLNGVLQAIHRHHHIYRLWVSRSESVWDGELVQYRERQKYDFYSDGSSGRLSDRVTTLNPVVLEYIRVGRADLVQHRSLFLDTTVGELINDGYHDYDVPMAFKSQTPNPPEVACFNWPYTVLRTLNHRFDRAAFSPTVCRTDFFFSPNPLFLDLILDSLHVKPCAALLPVHFQQLLRPRRDEQNRSHQGARGEG